MQYGNAQAPTADRDVDHLVDLHDVLRKGDCLIPHDDAEHGALVGVPVARRGRDQNGIVESRDAAAGARIAIAGRPVVDQDPAPGDQPPVDVRAGVGEEGPPARLEHEEELALVLAIIGRRRQLPRAIR